MSNTERYNLGKQLGSSKLAPLWTGPYRVIRELENRKNIYAIRKLRSVEKTKIVLREMLIVILRRYEGEEAKVALGELIADFKRPKLSTGNTKSTETAQQKRRGLHLMDAAELSELLRKLQEEEPEPLERRPGIENEEPSYGTEELSSENPRRKRMRSAHCVSWVDVMRVLS